MLRALIKPLVPSGLMWRAGLILLVPVATILLVVWIVLVVRHYDGVTRQMVREFTHVAAHVRAEIDSAPDLATARARAAATGLGFGYRIDLPAEMPGAVLSPPLWDLTGRLVQRELLRQVAAARAVQVHDYHVQLWLRTDHGLAEFRFTADRVSALNPHQLLMWMILAAILMTLIAFGFLRGQMRPIRQLAQAAEAFGRGRNVPFRPGGADEVRAAGQTFLMMRARIERHIEQRTLMLSGVSHDLRTPLTRLRLGLSMLDPDPEVQALLADVGEMEGLIDRFLDFVRSGQGEALEPCDLRALVDRRVAEAARTGFPVTLAADAAPAMVPLRPELFARALDNLLGNARRHASRARVTLQMTPDHAVVTVADDGPGIDPAHYAEAVKPFVRLDAARGTSRGSGVGLGLAIAMDAMHSHGGRLDLARDDQPGLGGLSVRLTLPRISDPDQRP